MGSRELFAHSSTDVHRQGVSTRLMPLLAIAGVILGGASFAGGKMSALGIVCGALVLSMVGSILAQLNITSNLQTAVEGVVLLVAIAGRRVLSRRRT